MATELGKKLIFREDIIDVLTAFVRMRGTAAQQAAVRNKTNLDVESIGVDPNDTSKMLIVFKEEVGP